MTYRVFTLSSIILGLVWKDGTGGIITTPARTNF